MNEVASVAEKLDRSRHDVLDLTLRNPLLNFRVLRAKGLKIIDEIPQEVYRILVREGRGMYFEAADRDGESGSLDDDQGVPEELLTLMTEAEGEDDPDELAMRHADNKLQTPYERVRLGTRLRNTYRHAHLSIEEQGVNILYLALGTLNWYESESSDIQRLAPLVLVPVELQQASARARFKVRWTEEEIDSNFSLETKLKTDFGIEFPAFPDAEDLDVDGYFKGVTTVASLRDRWSIDTRAIHLGFFSFSKLLIYKDLDPKVWPEDKQPPDHPVIRSLYGGDGFREDPPAITEEDHLDDRLKVSDTHQVVDSDSSQTLAVIDVKNGRNLVIQGPPGTGKSQTITNLIAEAIADDKRVLFVAEKMAALEVVKRRLDNVHIGDACLELHSHMATKRAALEELRRTLALGKPQLDDPTEERHLLEDRRKRLNEYSQAVNSPIGERGYTPNELIGKMDQIGRSGSLVEWPVLAIEGSASWSRQSFVQRREVVRELRALIERMGTPREHVYWGSRRTRYMPADRGNVQARLRAASEALRRCRDRIETLRAFLRRELDVRDPDPVWVERLIRPARRVMEAPSLGNVNHRDSARGSSLTENKWRRFLSMEYRRCRNWLHWLWMIRGLLVRRPHLGIQVLVDADALASALDAAAAVLEWRANRSLEGSALGSRAFSDLESWLATAHDQVDSLHEIVRFNQVEKQLAKLGLENVAKVAASWEDAGKHLVDLFDRACFSAWMEAAFCERSVLNEFDGGTHEEIIDGFRRLDEDLFQQNQAMVAQLHWERLPRQRGGGQLGVLGREFEKKRRHLPLRKLMTKAGNAIQQIKPVFMMSPLSIAKFIPPDSIRFDLVVFDEASQVRPVEALGAILRGQQAVVVGDSKQLPPTSFFDRMNDGEEDDEERSETADLESILGMFCAQGAPERMLRWHYRSRHESLITVSNNEFYDNRLVVFPSPDKGREDVGLRFRHDPTVSYKRGRGGRFNAGESRAVARAVMEHAQTSPDLTLGVAAFSLTQARRIEDELEILRRGDPSGEPFFAAHSEEPFFIKNLENVQGDERDVILISVGYGKVEGGYMPMNFGPLNKDGGERRLNVLITRARRRCVVYSNFVADDLDMRRTNTRGVQSLKTFLEYAQTGDLHIPQASGREADSPFEEAVTGKLRERGYAVDQQVGSAGFFIDLAVVDPQRPGRYLLGIECDGASYHSARSARDRDRLRQQVLEGLGWTIHRIWSTDWFRNPQRELAKAEESINGAAVNQLSGDPGARRHPAPLRRAETEVADEEVGATATPYEIARLEVHLGGQELHNVVDQRLLTWILEVVVLESPVHANEVALRVANAAGLKRAGKRIRERVGWAVRRGSQEGKLLRKGDFLWRPDHNQVVFRRRDDVPHGSLRQPDNIAPEEIGSALLQAIRASHGIDEDGAVKEACRLFGYKRVGAKIVARFRDILFDLVENGELERRGEQLHCPRAAGGTNQ